MLPRDSSWWLWLLTPLLYCYPTTSGGFACLNNPCINGVCIDDLNTSYSCYCIDGYTGIQCQVNWDECWSNPCQNGGICHDGIAAFNCSCPPGFVGDLCNENYNECESNPCVNNGSCIDGTNGYMCFCSPGYSGIHCEIDVAVCNITNETRCANGGICEEGPGVTFTCVCQQGWSGQLCEEEIDECKSFPCQNGAVCVDLQGDYACACLFGYTGKNCEEIVLHCEDDPCENNALCLTEEGLPVCYCVPDYHGDRCQFQYDECQLGQRCFNGGTCIDGIANFTCSCPPDLTGDYCECLILESNELDCTYRVTTISTTSNTATTTPITTTTLETTLQTIITKQTPQVDLNISTTTVIPYTQVPNISTTTFIENITSSKYPPTEIETEFPLFTNTTLIATSTVEDGTTLELSATTTDFSLTEYTSEAPEITTEISLTTLETIPPRTTQEPSSTEEITLITFPDTSSISTEKFTTSTETSTFSISTTTTEISVTSTEMTIQSEYPSSTTKTTTPTTTTYQDQTTTSIEQTQGPNISTTEITPRIPSSTEEISTITISTTETETIFPETSSYFGEYTTIIDGENVTKPNIDCTTPENSCQNGGTCIYSAGHYKCICPYDAEGDLCEVHLGIRNAAFAGDSYLTHRLANTSGTKIEFTTKTLSPSGLIFYSNIDTTYMALYIENGYLKFMFSCGYQTMLLSELRNPINDGFDMNVRAILEFNNDLSRCNATVIANNTLAMSGNQLAIVNHMVKPTSVLHLGGLPQEKLKDRIPAVGFIGCITDLKISDRKTDIFKSAEDGFKITECSSLACLSNPCNNGGTCMERNEQWSCHCKNGYLGKLCENSICDNNPCYFGATCLPFTGSGYICLCPFGKHGHLCEKDMEITEPNFSSSVRGISSYAAYPIPVGGISNNMELKFRFAPTTMEQISILMFIGQSGAHDATSDHMAVSFVKGYIMLTWNLGSGPRRIFTSRPLLRGKTNYLLQLGRLGRRAWISVDNLGNITGRSPGNLAQLDVVPVLYLGGHHSPNFSTLPHDLPLHTGFSGCIFEVELKSGNLIIPLQSSRQVTGRALGQCGSTECHEKLCQNGAACIYHGGTFACVCQDGWFGPLCSSKYNPCDYDKNNCSIGSRCVPLSTGYECDCPVGKIGNYCEIDEKLSDVSLSGKRSYISLKPLNYETSAFTIELQVRALRDRGLILFIGQNENSFLTLGMQSGLLELRILPVKRRHNLSEVLSIRSNKLLAIGIWYTIRIGKYGNKLYLYVENIVNTGILRNDDYLSISGETIYIGGLPNMSELPLGALPNLPVPFTGCIRQLMINSHHIPLTSEYIKNGQNIADCDGTPCGGDACENGGTCWLDLNLNPHCSCKEPYIGEKCEKTPSCQERSCQNKGHCVGTKCSCLMGYTGVFCETAMEVHAPQFFGNGHLVVKTKHTDKKRDLSATILNSFKFNFMTAQKNGLLLWMNKSNSFIGIGIEKGYIKLVYALKEQNHTVIDILPKRPISDGLWHNLEVTLNPSNFRITLDGKLLPNTGQNEVETIDTFSTDGPFYLGGLPGHDSELPDKTNGLFREHFSGCIEAFSLNKDKFFKDFSLYEGENVGTCEVF